MQVRAESEDMERARAILGAPIDVDAVMIRLALRGPSAQARRLAVSEQNNPRRAAAWQRLAMLMGSLASARPRVLARAMMFFIPDTRYFQQVFSLDDAPDGSIVACCEDVLQAALDAGVLDPQPGQPHRHFVLGTPQAIYIEQLDGKSDNVPPHCNSMTGWNRRALKITLPSSPAAEQIDAAAILCALSSLRWRDAQTQTMNLSEFTMPVTSERQNRST
jgi:hypothetical protein